MALIEVKPQPLQVASAVEANTVSAVDELMTGMSITPGIAGNFMIGFSATIRHSGAGSIDVALYVGGVEVDHARRPFDSPGAGLRSTVGLRAYIQDLTAAQAIEIRWSTSVATAYVTCRTLTAWESP